MNVLEYIVQNGPYFECDLCGCYSDEGSFPIIGPCLHHVCLDCEESMTRGQLTVALIKKEIEKYGTNKITLDVIENYNMSKR